ncbi:DUF6221 family protein [Streptomyces sp. CB03911]|uniref:DUF6221 family protein n=1 Tax=Streptomyces sp. CB03911 TaxID=1804758 RepID=UPI00094058F6|nr:DUF6221 family protein [Streptomyces sp. CB03911]OKI16615.1 hypothetical protein A6A07_11445 [Streptomyces sp. CB03911]
MSTDLAGFLLARLDEDIVEIGRHPDGEDYYLEPWDLAAAVEANYPCSAYLQIAKVRALAEVDAKRCIIDEHHDVNDGSCGTCVTPSWGYPTHGSASPAAWPCTTLRLLALPYAAHPNYRPEWAPTA